MIQRVSTGYWRIEHGLCAGIMGSSFRRQLGSFLVYNHFVKTKLDSKGYLGSGVGVIYAISSVIITAIDEWCLEAPPCLLYTLDAVYCRLFWIDCYRVQVTWLAVVISLSTMAAPVVFVYSVHSFLPFPFSLLSLSLYFLCFSYFLYYILLVLSFSASNHVSHSRPTDIFRSSDLIFSLFLFFSSIELLLWFLSPWPAHNLLRIVSMSVSMMRNSVSALDTVLRLCYELRSASAQRPSAHR